MATSSTPSTATGGGQAIGNDIDTDLYLRRQKIYPREVHGRFAVLRVSAVFALLGLYYCVPWITWNQRQALLFDIPARKFHIFGLTFWPQDFFFLAALLIIAALALFFFTALAGRLWCGFACPQTVWTEVFLWVERQIEGDRPRQMRLSRAPWSLRKLGLKTAKHGVWIIFSLWTGFTFVGYFTPILELATKIATLSTGPWETFWVLFYSVATYGNAGWLREQVCIYMCPYARFQSAMFDSNTLIISYDSKRGEPRGGRRRDIDPRAEGLGDCISCKLCVQACPTGIDIRDGLQYQCIGCAACIDACNEVMQKMQYPKGLIRYTTENALTGLRTRVLRPRVIIYGLALIALLGVVVVGISRRNPVDIDVIRDRNSLYRETNDGYVENIYTLKILNKDHLDHYYDITVSGLDGLQILYESEPVVGSGTVADLPVRLRMRRDRANIQNADVIFHIAARDNPSLKAVETARFIAPVTEITQ